jgi:hypothetical protein
VGPGAPGRQIDRDALYAYLLAPQPATQAVIKSLATDSPHTSGRKVKDVMLLGGKLEWSQGEQCLSMKLPEKLPSSEAARQSGCGSEVCCKIVPGRSGV